MSSSDNAEWVLMDYVNVVVHVFQTNTRILQYREFVGDAKITAMKTNTKKRKKKNG
jgi:ribosome-associated protein